jgi:predicted NBD/HSP70 family sugar kinase
MQLNRVNEINTTRVLQKIWFSSGISRADLARELGLVKSTVTKIVTVLLERNLVRVMSEVRSEPGVGRKPFYLAINGQYGCILGLEIQTEFYRAVAINLHGEVLFSRSDAITMTGKDIVSAFFEVMDRLKEPLKALRLRLIGIGVALAGIIDPHRGIIQQSNPLNITEPVYFSQGIKSRMRTPVVIENDANCCCWGELAFRKTARHNDFLFVLGEFRRGETANNLYWGIALGLGFVLNGRVYTGSANSAGEFQSILWKPGNEGQLSITNEEARRIKEDRAVMRKAFRELCAHVAFLVNTLNLRSVVFGGEIVEYRAEISEMLEAEIQRNWSYTNHVDCSVEFSTLNKDTVAYGAAGVFLESIFSIPEIIAPEGQVSRSKVEVLLRGRVREAAT